MRRQGSHAHRSLAQHQRLPSATRSCRADESERRSVYLITDNLSSHKSPPIRQWLEAHPRVTQVFIPVGACWLKACRRRGGGCFDARLWQDRASLAQRRSSWLRGSLQNSSTFGQNRGFGVVHRSPDGIGGVPLFTAFEERSINSGYTDAAIFGSLRAPYHRSR